MCITCYVTFWNLPMFLYLGPGLFTESYANIFKSTSLGAYILSTSITLGCWFLFFNRGSHLYTPLPQPHPCKTYTCTHPSFKPILFGESQALKWVATTSDMILLPPQEFIHNLQFCTFTVCIPASFTWPLNPRLCSIVWMELISCPQNSRPIPCVCSEVLTCASPSSRTQTCLTVRLNIWRCNTTRDTSVATISK